MKNFLFLAAMVAGTTATCEHKGGKFHDCSLVEIQELVKSELAKLTTIKINEDGTVKASIAFSPCTKNGPLKSPKNRPDPSCEKTTKVVQNPGLTHFRAFRDLVGVQEACLMGIASATKEVTQASVDALVPKTNTWNTLAKARAASLKLAEFDKHDIKSATAGRIAKRFPPVGKDKEGKKEPIGVKLNLVSVLDLKAFAPVSEAKAADLCEALK
jgi:hypothetical protein